MNAPELPAALSPWRAQLAILPRELAVSMGPLLQRLSVLVGSFPAHRQGDQGDPNGLDGISRRGRYERLMLSQWALAQEAPDEFVRRAAQQELQFLALARQRPDGRRRSVVLFDAGPAQMGAPRIFQVAALVLLAARAQAAGATFGFGLLQHPEVGLLGEVTAAAVRQLLAARGAGVPEEAHLLAWERVLGPPKALDDVWLVGDAVVPAAWKPAPARLWANDVLELEGRALAVTALRGGVKRNARVELPNEELCVRLVRDPFQVATAPRRVVSAEHAPTSNPVFSFHGQWMFTRGRPGQVVAWPVPNSPRAVQGQPRVLTVPYPNANVVAVGMRGRGVVVLAASEDALFFTTFNKRGSVESAVMRQLPRGPLMGPAVDQQVLRGLYVAPGNPKAMVLEDPVKNVVWRVALEDLAVTREAVNACCLSTVDRGVTVHAEKDGQTIATLCLAGPAGKSVTKVGWLAQHALVGPARSLRGFGGVLWGLRRGTTTHAVMTRSGPVELTPPDGHQVLGVCEIHKDGAHAALVVLEPDRRTVMALGVRTSLQLVRLPAPLLENGLCAGAPVLACVTTAGHVVLVSTLTGALLLQAQAQSGDVMEAA